MIHVDREELARVCPWFIDGLEPWWERAFPNELPLIRALLHGGYITSDQALRASELRRQEPHASDVVIAYLWRICGDQLARWITAFATAEAWQ